MKIVAVEVRDSQAIKYVSTVLDTKHQAVLGENSAGKTSLLNAVDDTLGTIPVTKIPDKKRHGADKAERKVMLGTITGQPELVVYAEYLGNRAKVVEITTANGDKVRAVENGKVLTPDQILKRIWGANRVDFQELAQLSDEKFLEHVLQSMGCGEQWDKLQAEELIAKDKRKDAKKDRDRLKAQLPPIAPPNNVVAIDTQKLRAQLEQLRQQKSAYDQLSNTFSYKASNVSNKASVVEQLRQQLAKAEQELEVAKQEMTSAQQALGNAVNPQHDIERLESDLSNAESTNQQAQAHTIYQKNRAEYDEAEKIVDKLEVECKSFPEKRRQLFRDNKPPLEELGINDDGKLCYNGVPITREQIAENEFGQLCFRLKLAQIAQRKDVVQLEDGKQLTPIRSILIENGSSFTSAVRQKCYKIAEDEFDIQTIIEHLIAEQWDEQSMCFVPDYEASKKVGLVLKDGQEV